MVNKEKLTKHIWLNGEKWKVEQVISPTKFDDFLLVSRKRTNVIHIDGKTTPIDMYLIDLHNEECHPDTKKIRDIYHSINKERKELDKKLKRFQDKLSRSWREILVDKYD